MKNILFFGVLMIALCISVNVTAQSKTKSYIRKSIDYKSSENSLYNVRNRELSRILVDAALKGQIKALNPGNNRSLPKGTAGNDLFSGKYYEEESLYPADFNSFRLLEEFDGTRASLKYLILVWPAQYSSIGMDVDIAKFNFADCERIFAQDPRAIWINPTNNADTMDYGKAIRMEKYKVNEFSIVNELNQITNGFIDNVDDLERTNPKLFALVTKDMERLNDPERDIFRNTVSPSYIKYTLNGLAYPNDPLNVSYGLQDRELAKYVIEAVNSKKLVPYINDFEKGFVPMSIEEFNRNREMQDSYSLDSAAAPEYNSNNAYALQVVKDVYIYADGERKEKIKSYALVFPYNNPGNMKGINVIIAYFYPGQLIAVLKSIPEAIYYHPQNLADSCNFGTAVSEGKFRFLDVFISNTYNMEILNISREDYKKPLLIESPGGDSIPGEIFLKRSDDPNYAQFYPFRDEVSAMEKYYEFSPSAKTKPGIPLYNKFTAYRSIDLSAQENQLLVKKKKELVSVLVNAAKEGRIKVYSRGIPVKPDSVKEHLKYQTFKYDAKSYKNLPDSSYDFNDLKFLKTLLVAENFVTRAGQNKSDITDLYIINPIELKDHSDYYFMLEFKYTEVLKFLKEDKAASKNKDLLSMMEKYSFKSRPVIACDIFNRTFFLDDQGVKDNFPQLSIFK
jgi:hypothetical protein